MKKVLTTEMLDRALATFDRMDKWDIEDQNLLFMGMAEKGIISAPAATPEEMAEHKKQLKLFDRV